MKKRDFKKELELLKKDIVNYGWENVLGALTPLTTAVTKLKSTGSTNGDICPKVSHKKNTDFRLGKRWSETGHCVCYNCGEHWDGFEVIGMFNNNEDFSGTVKRIKDLIYGDDHPWIYEGSDVVHYKDKSRKVEVVKPTYNLKREKSDEEKQQEKAESDRVRKANNDLWRNAFPLEHEVGLPGRLYFEGRGIFNYHNLADNVRLNPNVRYSTTIVKSAKNPQLFYDTCNYLRTHPYFVREIKRDDETIWFDLGNHPCLLFMMRSPSDYSPKTLQRIYITHDGRKLDFDPQFDLPIKKRMSADPLNSATGSACLFGPVGAPVIGVAEGPETTLTIRTALDMPVHSTIDANGLGEYDCRLGTYTVIIFADKDRSKKGEEKAIELAERLDSERVNVYIVLPPLEIPEGESGVDWNDAWKALGIDAFPEHIQRWEELA
ncbi:hypothetical protein BC455_18520 [Vibrio harveyi]|nr:hypothetical protein BC455_18520 [Vibrio harveyi]